MNVQEVGKFMVRISSSLSLEEFTDLSAVLFELGRNRDQTKAEVLLKKARYLLRDHADLISEWNSVSPPEFCIEAVDDCQHEEYENWGRKFGKYVRLVNDVKNRFWDRSDHVIKFLNVVVRNAKERNPGGRIYKEACELLEGHPDLMKQLACVLELPDSLEDDDMAAYYLSAEELEALVEMLLQLRRGSKCTNQNC